MQMSDTIRIEAARERVYEALNDPDILRRCIPGCESLEKTADDQMHAEVTAKVGPVKAKFVGEVTLSDLKPPEGYTISGQGKGGAAGFAKGGATVSLEADGDATNLHYDVKADVGGKLAQLGSRLIDGVAKRLAKEFFESFRAEVETPAASVDVPPAVDGDTSPGDSQGGRGKVYLIVLAALLAIAAYYFAGPFN